jgi:hypothetical protein
MAKGKHATALFEVIHAARRPPKASPTGGIPTPKWWFKSRKKSQDDSAPAAPAPEPRIVERIIERPVYIERPAPEPTRMRIGSGELPMGLDAANREIKFKLSYAGAVAAGFVLVVVLALAYLAGTRSSQASAADEYRPGNATAGALAAVPSPAVQPSVLNVGRDSTARTPTPSASDGHPAATPSAPPTTTPSVASDGKPTRQIGLHYVIAQSYPEAATAKRAADLLNSAGIACTVERGLPGYAVKSWFCVVGLKSFDHIQHNPELDQYRDTIESIGTKFAGAKSFNRFEPKLYKWRPEADQQQADAQ